MHRPLGIHYIFQQQCIGFYKFALGKLHQRCSDSQSRHMIKERLDIGRHQHTIYYPAITIAYLCNMTQKEKGNKTQEMDLHYGGCM